MRDVTCTRDADGTALAADHDDEQRRRDETRPARSEIWRF